MSAFHLYEKSYIASLLIFMPVLSISKTPSLQREQKRLSTFKAN